MSVKSRLVLLVVLCALVPTALLGVGVARAGAAPVATRNGVDYSHISTDWPAFFAAVKASGRDFIGRYLPVHGAMWRAVTTTELRAADVAGIDCFFWFEDSGNHGRAQEGYAAGVADAKEALGALASLGIPTTTPVYYTVDFPLSDGSLIDAYFQGIASVVPVSQIGAYGTYTTIDWLYQHGLATYFCQTTAWRDSRGWHPQAQMHQNTATYQIGGVYVDRLTVTVADFGQYRHHYEQSDPRLLYSGTWANFYRSSASAGIYKRSSTAGAKVTIPFNGTQLDWIAMKGTTTAKADVYLDGVFQTTIDLSASAPAYRVKVWSTGTLPFGYHTVQIVRNSTDAPGKYITLDAVEVTGTLASVTRYQQTDPHFVFAGTWAAFSTASASGRSYARANTSGASVTVTFSGGSLTWIATRGTTLGKAYVSLDGARAQSVNLARSSVAYQQKAWSTGMLKAGTHTVNIWWDPANIAGKYISIDAFDVLGMLN